MHRRSFLTATGLALAAPATAPARPAAPSTPPAVAAGRGAYARIGELRMYYEIHGSGGRPLVLLHGGLMTIDTLQPLLGELARTRQVIAVELEGHGRTADLDRPLSTAQMARDVAALLDRLKLGAADLFGYSMGGFVALQVAIHRPDLVRKLALVSTGYNNDFFYPSIRAQWPGLNADVLKGSPMEQAWMAVAPDRSRWPGFILKMRDLMLNAPAIPDSAVAAVKAPVLLALGDADMIVPEKAIAMYRLLGGALEHGGMGPLPPSQFAIVPGTTHFNILDRTDLLVPLTTAFLDRGRPAGMFAPG